MSKTLVRKRSRRHAVPLSPYRKALDRLFTFGSDATSGSDASSVRLWVRVFTLLPGRAAPQPLFRTLVLLCWTVPVANPGGWLKRMVDGLRQGIVRLPCPVSLVEHFVSFSEGNEVSESLYRVVRSRRGGSSRTDDSNGVTAGTVLLPLRRSMLEETIGEPLEDLSGREYHD